MLYTLQYYSWRIVIQPKSSLTNNIFKCRPVHLPVVHSGPPFFFDTVLPGPFHIMAEFFFSCLACLFPEKKLRFLFFWGINNKKYTFWFHANSFDRMFVGKKLFLFSESHELQWQQKQQACVQHMYIYTIYSIHIIPPYQLILVILRGVSVVSIVEGAASKVSTRVFFLSCERLVHIFLLWTLCPTRKRIRFKRPDCISFFFCWPYFLPKSSLYCVKAADTALAQCSQ